MCNTCDNRIRLSSSVVRFVSLTHVCHSQTTGLYPISPWLGGEGGVSGVGIKRQGEGLHVSSVLGCTVDGGEDGRVGAETVRLRQPPLVVMTNVDARVWRFHAAMKQRSLHQ